jgi:HD-GYP domain-containing protein (c-di-GMP phosphodiesterase class II)
MTAEADLLAQGTLDALTAHIAVLDTEGVIVMVNRAWQAFGLANPAVDVACPGVGANYLEVCRRAERAGNAQAGALAERIQAVISGQRETFELEYPCHGPEQRRWFTGRVTRFGVGSHCRTVIAHEDITPRKEAELSHLDATVLPEDAERKQAQQLIQRQYERLSALRAIDTVISTSLDLRLTLQFVLEQAISLLGVDAASVLLHNPYTHMLEFAAGRGFRVPVPSSHRMPIGVGQAGKAALERQPRHIPDVRVSGESFFNAALAAQEGIIAYFAVPMLAKGQVVGVLELCHRSPLSPDPEWHLFLETLAGQAAIAVENATLFENLQRSNMELMLAYDATIEGWSRALDLRDKETEGHTRRVTEMTVRLAQAMGLGAEETVQLRRGALLHDIGKMGIPDSILLKAGPLTGAEWEIMRKHPEYAYEMLYPITFLRPALAIPLRHHEMWDGAGYPGGLKGEQIPLVARIFAIADVWDALRSNRPYRQAWPEDRVREHMRSLSGSHFDPGVLQVFLGLTDS